MRRDRGHRVVVIDVCKNHQKIGVGGVGFVGFVRALLGDWE